MCQRGDPCYGRGAAVPDGHIDVGATITSKAVADLLLNGRKRNSIRGPGFKKVDMSLFKDFPMRGRMTAQVRVEVFNLFDWPFFSLPNTTITQLSAHRRPPFDRR